MSRTYCVPALPPVCSSTEALAIACDVAPKLELLDYSCSYYFSTSVPYVSVATALLYCRTFCMGFNGWNERRHSALTTHTQARVCAAHAQTPDRKVMASVRWAAACEL